MSTGDALKLSQEHTVALSRADAAEILLFDLPR
ncbi:MAG: hypothetical protein ACO1N5_01035 [Noviherbaspirillum sp.]